VELPDDVGADLAGGGQDPKEIPPRRWSERVSEASRILQKHGRERISDLAPSRSRDENVHGVSTKGTHDDVPSLIRLRPDPGEGGD
jgi:hypothetical protein